MLYCTTAQTNEATAMDTEAEMKGLSDEMRAEAGLPPAAAPKASAPAGQDAKDVEMVSALLHRLIAPCAHWTVE